MRRCPVDWSLRALAGSGLYGIATDGPCAPRVAPWPREHVSRCRAGMWRIAAQDLDLLTLDVTGPINANPLSLSPAGSVIHGELPRVWIVRQL